MSAARPWVIWVQSPSLMAKHGYTTARYATEEAAWRGVERMIAKGELRRLEDGSVVTQALGRPISVERHL